MGTEKRKKIQDMVRHSKKVKLSLATFFNFEISGLTDRFLIEIEEDVNPGTEKRQFSQIPFENRENMQVQIAAYDQQLSLFRSTWWGRQLVGKKTGQV